ncbi:DUF2269 family protein [Pseudofulvimonas gallinarii]|jgi:uncharacterized membrane protein|uniref:Putative membrane protein n=1 Tax=Pseudofulvimonas gallinarii TaxID=634155 RepID=A0A4S3L1J9_9GAMM|nr:DUF2269 domain-containing protein [Pseudofulvimonas gallinarii]TCS96171.1 putative membrane protein [Pseudofulvimonas gallinarii]THD14604.1 hypothetical protein B1808_02790 [Pseudofulvimonas gallinarii]
MEPYHLLKLVHILSATLLFGTGLGTAFFMWMAHRRGEVAAIAVTARHVVLADWLFTSPAVVAQFVSGALLVRLVGWPWTQPWLQLAIALFVMVGLCWLPVVAIQLRVRALAEAAWRRGEPLPPQYHRLMRWWFALGWPAFIGVVVIFVLMVSRPPLWGS